MILSFFIYNVKKICPDIEFFTLFFLFAFLDFLRIENCLSLFFVVTIHTYEQKSDVGRTIG